MSVFWESANVPVHCNVLCTTRSEALAAARGDIRLAVCDRCGFVCNTAFDPQRLRYGQTYENSLHFSPRFQDYAASLAGRLIEKYGLRDKNVIEIACGQGEFLRLLCRLGDNRGVGFDPSYMPDPEVDSSVERIAFVRDFYSRGHADYRADFICCRHALEHMVDPVSFLRTVLANTGRREDVIVFFEVPNVEYTLRDLGIWDIIYEHCCYFSACALARCFVQAGFAVDAVTEEYGGQFLTIAAHASAWGDTPECGSFGDPAPVYRAAAAFAGRFDEKLRMWKDRLLGREHTLGRVVVWGSGSKGVTFLNMLDGSAGIDFVVDINPRKAGMFVAGVGVEIVQPRFLRDYRPETVIIMNPLYEDEIKRTLASLNVDARVLLA
ncbi:MAG: class I SAM-dependent methyltransferase [Phycisphaerae bacterium]